MYNHFDIILTYFARGSIILPMAGVLFGWFEFIIQLCDIEIIHMDLLVWLNPNQ